ncbi:MAG TPA: tetratricopeptide repeat protein [Candidatus Polarisedimenticolia bacterium]|jgi:tetratricopeptide (TPR) repeat protein
MPSRRSLLWILLLLPFVVRFVYFFDVRSQPYLQWNMVVGYVNHAFAEDLAAGRGAPYDLYRSPWYPLLISGLYRLFGPEPMAARVFQWILGGCGCLSLFVLTRSFFGERCALVALAASGLYAPAIFLEGELLEQGAASFLLLAGFTLMGLALREHRPRPALSAPGALLIGLGCLMRPDLLACLPFLGAAAALAPNPRARKIAMVAAVASAGLLAVVLLRHPGPFIDVGADRTGIHAAVSFYHGNNAEANGLDVGFPEVEELPTEDPEARREHMTGLDLAGIRYATSRTGGGLETVAPFWLGEAGRFIRSRPATWLSLLGRKTLMFLGGRPVGSQKDILFARSLSPILSVLLFCAGICVPLGLIIPFAIGGLAAAGPAHRFLLFLAVPAGCFITTLLFVHDFRFQHAAVPFLIALAAHGLLRLLDGAGGRRGALAALVAVALVISNVDFLGTREVRWAAEHFRVGTMHLERDELALADAAYRRSIGADPGYAPSIDNLVYIAKRTGQYDGAIEFLSGVVETGRYSWRTLRALADLAIAAGRREEGEAMARRLRQEFPERREGYEVLAGILAGSGRAAEARRTLEDGLVRFPGDAALSLNLAASWFREGACAEALPLTRKVLDETEEYPEAFSYAGHCLAAEKDFDGAAGVLLRGLRRHPGDITMLGLLGQVYGEMGRRGDEQRCYREVLERRPDHAEALYRLAVSLAAEGRRDEALSDARRAQALGHPEAGRLIESLSGNRRR